MERLVVARPFFSLPLLLSPSPFRPVSGFFYLNLQTGFRPPVSGFFCFKSPNRFPAGQAAKKNPETIGPVREKRGGGDLKLANSPDIRKRYWFGDYSRSSRATYFYSSVRASVAGEPVFVASRRDPVKTMCPATEARTE